MVSLALVSIGNNRTNDLALMLSFFNFISFETRYLKPLHVESRLVETYIKLDATKFNCNDVFYQIQRLLKNYFTLHPTATSTTSANSLLVSLSEILRNFLE